MGVGLTEDFESSAIRHFKDAELLLREGRHDNAGHLLGISGECAVKAACLQESGERPSKHFSSVGRNDLRTHAPANLIGRKGQRILTLLPKVFVGWSVDQRYCRTGTITAAAVVAWQSDARQILDALQGV